MGPPWDPSRDAGGRAFTYTWRVYHRPVAQPPDDDDADYSLDFAPPDNALHPTMELQTSDLLNLQQAGVATAKPNLVIQLDGGETIELQPGWSQVPETSRVVVDDTPSVILAAEPALRIPPAPAPVQPLRPAVPREIAPPRSGRWLVVIVYVLAAAALALALYERFGLPA